MARTYNEYAMKVDNIYLGLVVVRDDVKARFNITFTAEETDIPPELRYRKQHRRNLYADADATAAPTSSQVDRTPKAYVPTKRNIRSGKKIRIPTGLLSVPPSSSTATAAGATRPGNMRFATISFPGSASNFEIARWLNTKLAAHKPAYFITPAGARFPIRVAALAGAVAPPEAPAPAA